MDFQEEIIFGMKIKKIFTGKEYVNKILELGNNEFSQEHSFELAKFFFENCMVSKVPYDPFSEFINDNDNFYCFIVLSFTLT
jgi:hypothetical protein